MNHLLCYQKSSLKITWSGFSSFIYWLITELLLVRSLFRSSCHVGVLQGGPAGLPRGAEGRALSQSPDVAAGRRSWQNHEAGAAEDDGKEVKTRRWLSVLRIKALLWTWVDTEYIHRHMKAFELNTSQEGEDMVYKKDLPQQLLLWTGSIATRSAASLSACDTLYLSVHSLALLCVARKGSVIGVCEACACPCMVTRHVCGRTVSKGSIPPSHTHKVTHTHTHTQVSGLRLFSPSTLSKLNNADGVLRARWRHVSSGSCSGPP